MPSCSTVVVIPARLESTRLPGKVLADLLGHPMIWWVWSAARRTPGVDETLVATDSPRIREVVEGFGGRAVMTGSHHQSGTDRIAEAVAGKGYQVVVNVQGDQPLIEPEVLSALVAAFARDPVPMATLVTPLTDPVEAANPERVKVVARGDGRALYFSRSAIPYPRPAGPPGRWLKHIGVYAFRGEFLERFTRLERTPLEVAESLEQLRALESGYDIGLVEVEHDGFGVETAEDLGLAAKRLRERQEETPWSAK